MNDFEMYENLTRFRKPLIELILDSLEINSDSKGIDMGCGIGKVMQLITSRKKLKNTLLGLDFSKELIDYGRKNSLNTNTQFVQGDVNKLEFEAHSFDWIWSMDTIWPGPKEYGCPSENPDEILNQFYKILKPNGKLFLLFWAGQKLLPGYPLLEAQLNSSSTANTPFTDRTKPENHILFGKKWLLKAGFQKIRVKSFVGDINGPLNEEDKTAVGSLIQMLWAQSKNEVSKEDWDKFNELCSPKSDSFILTNPNYYGYYVYTLFEGIK